MSTPWAADKGTRYQVPGTGLLMDPEGWPDDNPRYRAAVLRGQGESSGGTLYPVLKFCDQH